MRNTLLISACAVALLALGGCPKKNGTITGNNNNGGSGTNQNQGVADPFKLKRPAPKPRISAKAQKALSKARKSLAEVIATTSKRGGKWESSECEKAAKAFAEIAEDNAADKNAVALARFNEGVAYGKCKMTGKAKVAFAAALTAKPKYAPAIVNLAQIKQAEGNEAEAYKDFVKAVHIAPLNLAANYNLAVIFERKARNREKAPAQIIKFWKRSGIKIKSAYDAAGFFLRVVLAQASASRTIEMSTLHLKSYNLLMLLYMEKAKDRGHRGKLLLSELVLTEAAKVKNTVKQRGWISVFCDPARKGENATVFEHALAEMRNISGLIRLRRNQLVLAMKEFDLAMACDIDFIDAHLNRAAIALGFRGYLKSQFSFNRVLKLKPKHLDATVGLGVAYRGIASLVPNQNIPDGPSSLEGNNLDEKRTFWRKYWYTKAEAQYRKAIALDASYAPPHFNLGHLYKDYLAQGQGLKLAQTIALLEKAKGFFQAYKSKPGVSKKNKAKADEEIKDADYQIKQNKELQKLDAKRKGGGK